MSTPTAWRAPLKVHPAAADYPMMTGEQFAALVADIRKNGLLMEIVGFVDPSDESGEVQLLDGRNRLAAIEEAIGPIEFDGYNLIVNARPEQRKEWKSEPEGSFWSALARYQSVNLPFRVESGGDPWGFAESANLHRRHLSAEQRRDVIAALLKANPERSDRATAKIAGVSDKTVAAVRAEAEARAEIPHVETRRDTKGRRQPARKPAPPQAAAAPTTPPSQARDIAIAGFGAVLHQQLQKTLDDLTRLLGSERDRIREIPRERRIALARRYLDALGVSIDDLGDGGEP